MKTGGEGRQPLSPVSLGVAMFPDDGETLSSVMAAADRALYNAKTAGRNRVSLYTPGPGEEIITLP